MPARAGRIRGVDGMEKIEAGLRHDPQHHWHKLSGAFRLSPEDN